MAIREERQVREGWEERREDTRGRELGGYRVIVAERDVVGSVTTTFWIGMLGPVKPKGARVRPLRRQASAAAVAIGPGRPFTITWKALVKEAQLDSSRSSRSSEGEWN